jgi:hypothetical protein
MTLQSLIRLVWRCALLIAVIPLLQAAAISPAEKGKIEALISHLETLKDATFVRNGSDYDSKTAAKFLRGKWDANKQEINTVADFISKAATKSSTSGKPYVIRLNGVDTPCADYLNAQLKKLGHTAIGKSLNRSMSLNVRHFPNP